VTTEDTPAGPGPAVLALVVGFVAGLLVMSAAAPAAGAPSAGAAGAPVPMAASQGGAPSTGPRPTLPEPEPSTEESDRAADEILSGEEYQEAGPSLLERIWEWIVAHLPGQDPPDVPEPNLRPRGVSAPSIDLKWPIILALLTIAVLVALRVKPGTGRRRVKARKKDPVTLTVAEARLAPDEWLDEARRLEGDHEWKGALRCRFRALVGELIGRGVAHDQPGRTSGELRADVRRQAPDRAAAFAEAAGLFDDAWYGDAPTGPVENERFRRLADEVLATGPGAPGAGPGQRPLAEVD
jgi:hypothetical protein